MMFEFAQVERLAGRIRGVVSYSTEPHVLTEPGDIILVPLSPEQASTLIQHARQFKGVQREEGWDLVERDFDDPERIEPTLHTGIPIEARFDAVESRLQALEDVVRQGPRGG